MSLNRRDLIKGGLVAAATVPWITSSPAAAACPGTYPRIGHRVFVGSDNRVFGLSIWSMNARGKVPSEGTVSFSQEPITRLLQVSFQGGDADPRTIKDTNRDVQRAARRWDEESRKKSGEKSLLRDSNLYWVQTNPVWLYVLGSFGSMCIYPFVQELSGELGSRIGSEIGDWLFGQRQA